MTAAAAASGVSIEELGAVVTVATRKTIPLTSTVEGLRGLLANLQRPTSEGEKALAKYGLTVNYATLRSKGLAQTLAEIKAKVGDDAAALHDITGSQQAFALATALTSDNLKGFNTELGYMEKSAGAGQRSAKIIGEGFENTGKQFKAAVETFQVGATKTLLPVGTQLVKMATGLVYALDAIPRPIKTVGLAMVGAAAAVGLLAGTILSAKGLLGLMGFDGVAAATAMRGAITLLTRQYAASTVATSLASKATEAFTLKTAIAAGRQGLGALSEALKSQGAAVAGSLGALTLMGAIVTKLASDYARARDEVGRLNDELVTTGEHFSNVKTGFNTGNLLGRTGKELADAGVTVETIDKAIKKQRDALEQETVVLPGSKPKKFNSVANAAQIIPGFGQTIKAGLEGAGEAAEFFTEDAEVKTAPLAKDDPRRKVIEGRIEALKRERAELVKAQEARRLSEEAAAKANSPFDKTAAEQAFREAKQRIDLSDQEHSKKLAQLKELQSSSSQLLQADFNLRLELSGDILRAEKAAAKEKEDAEKKNRLEKAKNAIQEIENSHRPTQVKIADLNKLAKQYEKNGEIRRSIEDKVLAYETKIQKAREQLAERQRKHAIDRAGDEIKSAEFQKRQLEKLQDEGLDTFAAQGKQVTKAAEAEKKQVKVEAERAKAKTTDPGEIKDIDARAKQQIIDINRETEAKLSDLKKQGGQFRLNYEAEMVQKEVDLAKYRTDQLAQYVISGNGSKSFYEQQVLDRLALQEKEIDLQAQLAEAQTKDPQKIALIELEAERQKQEAKRATRDEIEATTKAIEEQRNKIEAGRSKEFSGGILSLEEYVQGENARFADDGPKHSSEIGAKKRRFIPGLNEGLRRDLAFSLDRDPLPSRETRQSGGFNGPPTVKIDLSGTIVVEDKKGNELGKLEELDINGQKYRRQARSAHPYG